MDQVAKRYHPDIVEAFASAWASIDGKLSEFNMCKVDLEFGQKHGTYDGYMIEANELLSRAAVRINNFSLLDRLRPGSSDHD